MPDAKQDQRSKQSTSNPPGAPQGSTSKDGDRAGIGASQGQDRERRPSGDKDRVPRTGHGTADIERESADSQGTTESLTDDSVGAFKERP